MDTSRIHALFQSVSKRTSGIKDILLVSDDGFPILSLLATGDEEMRATAAGAIMADAGSKGIKELGLGEMEFNVTVGELGYFITRRLVKGIVLLVIVDTTDPHASPAALVMLRVRRLLPELMLIMDENSAAS